MFISERFYSKIRPDYLKITIPIKMSWEIFFISRLLTINVQPIVSSSFVIAASNIS